MNSKGILITTLISLTISLFTIVISFIFFARNKGISIDSDISFLQSKCQVSIDGGKVDYNVNTLGIRYEGVKSIASESIINYKVRLSSFNTNVSYYFVWEWNKTSDQYIKAIEEKEYTITIKDGERIIANDIQFPNYSTETFVIGNDVVEVKDKEVVKDYLISIKFYNYADKDQSVHLGKNYNGILMLESVKCT